jgi:hypothetical protein
LALRFSWAVVVVVAVAAAVVVVVVECVVVTSADGEADPDVADVVLGPGGSTVLNTAGTGALCPQMTVRREPFGLVSSPYIGVQPRVVRSCQINVGQASSPLPACGGLAQLGSSG